MFDDVDALDGELKYIASLLDQVRGKLGDRFLRLELADHRHRRAHHSECRRDWVRPSISGLPRREWMHCISSRAIRDVNKDVPDNPDKLDAVVAAIGKLKQSMIPLSAEVAIQIGFK